MVQGKHLANESMVNEIKCSTVEATWKGRLQNLVDVVRKHKRVRDILDYARFGNGCNGRIL